MQSSTSRRRHRARRSTAAYFSATKPRRILRVRVISSSSASNSLLSTRKRRMREARGGARWTCGFPRGSAPRLRAGRTNPGTRCRRGWRARPNCRPCRVDRDALRDKRAAVAKGHRFADIGAEFQLVLDELRRKGGAVGELSDIPARSMITRWPRRSINPASPVARPAVFGNRRASPRAACNSPGTRRGAHQHLAVSSIAQIGAGEHPADRVGIDLAVGLHRAQPGQLGGAVDLLEVDPERAEKAERVGAERRAAGIDQRARRRPSWSRSGP